MSKKINALGTSARSKKMPYLKIKLSKEDFLEFKKEWKISDDDSIIRAILPTNKVALIRFFIHYTYFLKRPIYIMTVST